MEFWITFLLGCLCGGMIGNKDFRNAVRYFLRDVRHNLDGNYPKPIRIINKYTCPTCKGTGKTHVKISK